MKFSLEEIETITLSFKETKNDSIYRVIFRGCFVTVGSGKRSWNSLGAAKNAIRRHFSSNFQLNQIADKHFPETFYSSKNLAKKLETCGLIRYIKI